MSYKLRILSLGAGVQSSTIFLMSCLGELPKPHVAIFADTGWETLATYHHLEWLEEMGKIHGIPIIRVSNGSIRDGLLNCKTTRYATPPLYIDTESGGMARRQCTYEHKIIPIKKKARELLGLKPRQRAPMGAVEQWIGISLDELKRTGSYRPDRMTSYKFPLIEFIVMNRQQCIQWIARRFPNHIPPKSSCVICPYHTDDEWRALTPSEFRDACLADEKLRETRYFKNPAYLHRSCKPLADIDFTDHQLYLPFDTVPEKHSLILEGLEL